VIPSYYTQRATGGIVEAPWQPSKDNDWMLYQTVHGRRILWGSAYCGDFDQNASGFVRYMRALGDFKVGTLEKKDIETIREKGFTMLLLHEIACYRVAGPRGGELFAFMEKQLRRRFGQPKEEFSERPRLLPHDFENRAEWGRVLRFGI